ncbi:MULTISPECIES: hypothetical protein [Providencia]|nr:MULTISPECIES: hypothetical protein [Providencia]MBP6123250.1 hypothetical protein [Providencia sp.]
MNSISSLINEHKYNFSQHTFFSQENSSLSSVDKKLCFLPNMSFFIMGFGDLNKFTLPFIEPNGVLEDAVNTHAHEDANHWPWFIHDLRELGLNHVLPLSDTLEFLWSEQLAPSRKLTYDLVAMLSNQPAKFRLVIIEVMEATGNVMFSFLKELVQGSNFKLKFCGDLHLSHESGHAMGSEYDLIDTLDFSYDEHQYSAKLIENSFQAFQLFIDQLDNQLEIA